MNNPHDAIGEMLRELGARRNTSGPSTKAPHYWKRFPSVLGQPRLATVYLELDAIKVEMDDSEGTRHFTKIDYGDPDSIDKLEWLFQHGDLEFYEA